VNTNNSSNPGLTVRFRGVRGSIPSPGRETARYGGNTSCVELRCDGHILILDAGSGIRSLGNDLQLEFGEQSIQLDVIVSHTHWDHIQGLPFFVPAYCNRNSIRILYNEQVAPNLGLALRGQMQSLHFPVAFNQMHGLTGIEEMGAEPVRLGPYTIRSTVLNHPGGCTGFRIDTAYGSMAYLPDHEPFGHGPGATVDRRRETLIEFLRTADLLVLDTQYTEEEYHRHVGWGHGCLPDSVALAADAGARQLAFFHHDPSHRDYQIDLMIDAARKIRVSGDLKIFAAAEMDTVVLSPQGRESRRQPNENQTPAATALQEREVLTSR